MGISNIFTFSEYEAFKTICIDWDADQVEVDGVKYKITDEQKRKWTGEKNGK